MQKLNSDSNRQAHASISGYIYQIWNSVFAWLQLNDGQVIFPESAEDHDIHDPDDLKVEAVQIKNKPQGTISLASKDATSALNNFYKHITKNPKKDIHLKFITTSSITKEKGDGLGDNTGIELWKECCSSKNLKQAKLIVDFLLKESKIDLELKGYLSNTTIEEIYDNFIAKVDWQPESKSEINIRKEIDRSLINHGNSIGVGPNESKKVAAHLFEQMAKAASANSDVGITYADFLLLFEELTHELVPKNIKVTKTESESNSYSKSLYMLESEVEFAFTPPDVPDNFIQRSEYTKSLLEILDNNQFLLLTGLNGSGKTTLSKIISKEISSDIIWCSFRGFDARQLFTYLKAVNVVLDKQRNIKAIVLDDISFRGDVDLYRDELISIINKVFSRGGNVIITSSNTFPVSFKSAIKVNERSFHKAQFFSKDETRSLISDKVSPESIESWVSNIHLVTRGHPKLVDIYLYYLKRVGFDKSKIVESLFKPPEDIEELKAQLLTTVIDELSSDEQNLLFKLSMMTGVFQKQTALNLADDEPKISSIGLVMEKLIGPWLDKLASDYYNISPLIENIATKVYSKDQIKDIHGQLSRAILKNKNLSPSEYGSAFLHAWVNGQNENLQKLIGILFKTSDKVWGAVAEHLFWFIEIKPNDAMGLVPNDNFLNSMFRTIQYKIACKLDKDKAVNIAKTWDQETKLSNDPSDADIAFRIFFLGSTLMTLDNEFDIIYLMDLLKEFNSLKKKSSVFDASKQTPEVSLDLSSIETNISHMFMCATSNVKEISEFEKLIDYLNKLPKNELAEYLEAIKSSELMGSLFVERVWLEESKKSSPNWQACIEVYKKCVEYSDKWGVDIFLYSSIKSIIVIYDEYLDNSTIAKEYFLSLEPEIQNNPIVQDAIATVYYREKQHDKALKIYEKILPDWTSGSDNILIFGYRKAAICAANLKNPDYEKAAKLFLDGYNGAKKFESVKNALSYKADAGYCLWKLAEKRAEALQLFYEVLTELEKLPNTSEQVEYYRMHKLIGHILQCIIMEIDDKHDDNLGKPYVGLCSNPDINEDILKLIPTPIEYSWLTLVNIEALIGQSDEIYQKKYDYLAASRYPTILVMLYVYRVKKEPIDKLHNIIEKLVFKAKYESLEFSPHERPIALLEERVENVFSNEISSDYKVQLQYNLEFLYLASVLSCIDDENRLSEIKNKWKESALKYGDTKEFTEFIDLVDEILANDLKTSLSKLNTGATNERIINALNVMYKDTADPNEAFLAHLNIYMYFRAAPKFNNNIVDMMDNLITNKWLKLIENQFFFINPLTNCPKIKTACVSEDRAGLSKIANILLQVLDSVKVNLDQSILKMLKEDSAI